MNNEKRSGVEQSRTPTDAAPEAFAEHDPRELPPLRPHEDSMVLGFGAFKEALRDFGLIRSR